MRAWFLEDGRWAMGLGRIAGVVVALVLAGSVGHGSIEWDSRRQTVRVARGVGEVRTAFRFVNRGAPVKVTHVSTSCGCTDAILEDRELGADEAGALRVVFRVESRRGVQRKYIRVETDDPGARVAELVLVVEIPDSMFVAPRFVWWEGGGSRGAKSVWVDALGDARIKSVRARATQAAWGAEPLAVREGMRYRVLVRAPEGGAPGSTVVAVTVEFADGPTMSVPIFARVFGEGEGLGRGGTGR